MNHTPQKKFEKDLCISDLFRIFTYMKEIEKDWTHGLSGRHIQQIIRRKMVQQSVPSKKVYSRKKFKKDLDFSF